MCGQGGEGVPPGPRGRHPPVDRQTRVKILPCPKLHLLAVKKVYLLKPHTIHLYSNYLFLQWGRYQSHRSCILSAFIINTSSFKILFQVCLFQNIIQSYLELGSGLHPVAVTNSKQASVDEPTVQSRRVNVSSENTHPRPKVVYEFSAINQCHRKYRTQPRTGQTSYYSWTCYFL